MEFEAIIYRIMPAVTGTSARGNWTKQEVIFEMPGEFNRKVCVAFWGEKVQELSQYKVGDKLSVSANVESREYNGRWFTEVRAWRVTRAAQEQFNPISSSEEFIPFAGNPNEVSVSLQMSRVG